jgi:hypothetical protein
VICVTQFGKSPGSPVSENVSCRPAPRLKTGAMPFCKVGEILMKNGKRWRVAVVNEDFTMAGLKAVPIHRVFLTDKL